MFGNLNDMMGKLKETQEKIAITKNRLDDIILTEESNDKLLKVTISANRTIKSIEMSDDLFADKEQLEDYLITYLNRAITKATEVQEKELGKVAKEGMPAIPGMDLFK